MKECIVWKIIYPGFVFTSFCFVSLGFFSIQFADEGHFEPDGWSNKMEDQGHNSPTFLYLLQKFSVCPLLTDKISIF